jgi:anti-sigma regulatory factor (Ser/Thr protein kinase)/Na+-translocating ferredoxin:NAD+ oxidoreductase RNF subunit RnfB
MIITESYKIIGGNFDRAGLASNRLKERLKKIGVEPTVMRRIMIAAYEAEMNVVIHAYKGDMWVILNTNQIQIEVRDEGPGIPNIEQAMKAGFSTASAEARLLGFGAGLGLPNIKKHSDLFEIDSTVGHGTWVKATIFLNNQEPGISIPHSLHVIEELCCGCLRCLHICPTKAIRVRGDRPQILDHLCIDCTACIAVCKTGALTMQSPDPSSLLRIDEIQNPFENPLLVLPSSFLVQFGPEADPKRVLEVLKNLGFRNIRLMEGWKKALREAVIKYTEEKTDIRPIISPVCPAVINVIEMRFPALLEHVATYLSPVEAACDELQGEQLVFVPACPSQYTALIRRSLPSSIRIMTLSNLFQAVLPLIHKDKETNEYQETIPRQSRLSERDSEQVLQVSGIRNVLNALEKVENGLLNDIPVLEFFACDQGCFGSPLLREESFIACYRWLHSFVQYNPVARAIRRRNPLLPRTGFRLDPDMSKAIQKLSEIDRLTRELPGKDCDMCGAPTCASLAEDIVMGRATRETCLYLSR